jgi:hypothetical protein
MISGSQTGRSLTMSDYTKMWESPGLDLEGHDALLSVLGNACSDIFPIGAALSASEDT